AAVGLLADRLFLHRLVEARPARTRLELRLALEELLPARGADIGAVALVLPVLAGEGRLRPVLAQHLVLLGRELLPPLLVGLLDLLAGFGGSHGVVLGSHA